MYNQVEMQEAIIWMFRDVLYEDLLICDSKGGYHVTYQDNFINIDINLWQQMDNISIKAVQHVINWMTFIFGTYNWKWHWHNTTYKRPCATVLYSSRWSRMVKLWYTRNKFICWLSMDNTSKTQKLLMGLRTKLAGE